MSHERRIFPGVLKTLPRNKRIALGVVAVAILVGTGFALTNISLVLGTMPSYDFVGRGTQPATVQFHTFVMKPGDTIPWHYHKALTYVVLERGTITEMHADPNSGACVSEDFSAGNAFIEDHDQVHTVRNTGKGSALITWATAYPSSDGVLQIAPQFGAGGIYFDAPPPPSCN